MFLCPEDIKKEPIAEDILLEDGELPEDVTEKVDADAAATIMETAAETLSWVVQVEVEEAAETQSKDDNVTPMMGTNLEVMYSNRSKGHRGQSKYWKLDCASSQKSQIWRCGST